MKIKIIDKLSARTYDVVADTDRICLGSQLSYMLGMQTKCYPMTADRFATIMRHLRPGFGAVYAEAYVLPDTIRLVVSELVLISPGGVDIIELLYDLRTGSYGVVQHGAYLPLKFSWEHMRCGSHVCVLFGVLIKEADMLRHVPIIFEREYVEWLRAVTGKRTSESWDVIRARLEVYESTLNHLLQELAKVADRSAYELAVTIISQARNLLSQLSQLQQQRQ